MTISSEPTAIASETEPSALQGARMRERWAPYFAGLLLALPVLLFAYPPMSDLPLHEGTISLMRHYGDPTMVPPGLYFVNLGHPNQLFHLTAYALSLLMSTAMACKIVVAVSVGSLPVAAAHLASHVGASRWTALIVAPIALGWLFFMGLVANIIGLVLLLALFPMLDAFVARPDAKGAAKALGGAVLLYFAHEAMMFDFAAAILLFGLGYPFKLRDWGWRLAVFVTCVAITLAQLAYQRPLWTRATAAVPTVFIPMGMKVTGLPGVLFGAYDQVTSAVLLALVSLAMVALAQQRWREHRAHGRSFPRGWQALLHRYRFEIFALCLFAAYMGYPATLNSATLVYHRFLPPAFAVAAIVVSPRRLEPTSDAPASEVRIHRLAAVLAGIAPIASILVVWPAFAEQSRNFREVEALTPHIEKGSASGVIVSGHVFTHGFVKATMGIRAMTDRGGRMMYSFTESPISPVMLRPEYQWPEPIDRVVQQGMFLCPSFDFTRFRYILLFADQPQAEYFVSKAVEPDAKVVARAGGWTLLESTHPTVSLLSPDADPPVPCPGGTLSTRIDRVAASLRERMKDEEPPK